MKKNKKHADYTTTIRARKESGKPITAADSDLALLEAIRALVSLKNEAPGLIIKKIKIDVTDARDRHSRSPIVICGKPANDLFDSLFGNSSIIPSADQDESNENEDCDGEECDCESCGVTDCKRCKYVDAADAREATVVSAVKPKETGLTPVKEKPVNKEMLDAINDLINGMNALKDLLDKMDGTSNKTEEL